MDYSRSVINPATGANVCTNTVRVKPCTPICRDIRVPADPNWKCRGFLAPDASRKAFLVDGSYAPETSTDTAMSPPPALPGVPARPFAVISLSPRLDDDGTWPLGTTAVSADVYPNPGSCSRVGATGVCNADPKPKSARLCKVRQDLRKMCFTYDQKWPVAFKKGANGDEPILARIVEGRPETAAVNPLGPARRRRRRRRRRHGQLAAVPAAHAGARGPPPA